jgi:heme-degrading monooxygenase HmoA
MIARIWRGATKAEDGETYLRYLHETGLRAFRETPGNVGAYCLRRVVGGRAEFQIVSLWESLDAVRRFAGDEIDRAVFYDEDERFLVERENSVAHFDVVYRDEPVRVG